MTRATTVRAKVYTWVPGSRLGYLNASIIGAELDRLIEGKRQKLKAEDVVEAARNPRSPLHKAFEWDNRKAGHAYRLTQARHLLRSVQIKIITPQRKEQTIRATVAYKQPEQPHKRFYSTMADAMSDPDRRAEVVEQALREFRALRRKYAELHELAQVFAAIDHAGRK